MSLHEELAAARRCVDDLTHRVLNLERALGPGIETRRLRGDAERLRESLALLAAAAAAAHPAGAPAAPDLVPVPDTPYDDRLWVDADDEGLGTRRGPAPGAPAT
ncbi:hypothetical protein E1265_15160 [Streptomyces sp. 8K308]|uniref:hypothetical protein n=1 Tax=Streptomyces sp. 8K308 TaxID=2530388 RepID=UPI0010457A58|nr:hypothetical protein [Streptomyces sp. 8K308]TDC22662.1 hypothetical protein E1265_15160 [Streptomyces sp. 8K308]